MADNGSNQEKQGTEKPEDHTQDPAQEGRSAQAVNVVRVDELQDTITKLMKKAWENLPPSSGGGVTRPLAQGEISFLLPFGMTRPSLPPVSGEGRH